MERESQSLATMNLHELTLSRSFWISEMARLTSERTVSYIPLAEVSPPKLSP